VFPAVLQLSENLNVLLARAEKKSLRNYSSFYLVDILDPRI